jgi:hypothetical protein
MRFLDHLLHPPATLVQWIAFLVMAAFAIMMLYVGTTQFLLQRRLLAHARPVDATILRSEVTRSESADTDRRLLSSNSTISYSPEIRFRYLVNGAPFESEMLTPNAISVGHASEGSAAEVLTPFPVGATVTAYVDPSLPDQGFLIRSAGAGPIVFLLVGLIVLPIAWFGARLV